MLPNTNTEQQGKLAFAHQTASTSTAALKSTRPSRQHRKQAVENVLLMAGRSGATRYELAERLELPIQTICGLARPMVKAGDLIEAGDKRPSPHGSPSKILRLPRFAEVK